MSNQTQIDILNTYIEQAISKINVLLPAKVVKYDFTKQKVSVKPLINKVFGDDSFLELPIINNVPLMFPASGGASITMPVNVGDIVELRFCQGSLEEWLNNGTESTPDDSRSHDLTDAIATPGLRPFNVTSPASNNEDLEIKYKGSKITIDKKGKVVINSSDETDIIASSKISVIATDVEVTSTTAKVTAVSTIIASPNIKLGGLGASQGVARIGDAVSVDPVTHQGTILAGSAITKSL